MKRTPKDEKQFEIDVRSIARQIWPSSGYDGPITIDGRERDSIFVTEDVVHYLEITTSKSEKKAKDDLSKIHSFLPKLAARYPGKIAKGWWITLYEASGEQGRHIEQYRGSIFHCTYQQFLSKLINSAFYLSCRERVAFGSARNIFDNSIEIPNDEFVPSLLIGVNGEKIQYHNFVKEFDSAGHPYLITGEFGVGKSMFARQLFLDLSQAHKSGRDNAFPVYINLRDHTEQRDPHECLMRHAKSIGFPNSDQLVRAWLAGYVYLILDGFDELTPTVTTKESRRAKEIRRSSLELVRRFIDQTPGRKGIVVLGRSNFFDSVEDLVSSLGLKLNYQEYRLVDFNEDQIRIYLLKKKYTSLVPQWLPKRPLLIGYLVGKKLIDDTVGGVELDRVSGWRKLLDLVCEREVGQVYLALEPTELLRVYARIGTKCRKKISCIGPVSLTDCRDAFFEVLEVEPEGRSLVALMRLPGMVGVDTNKLESIDVSLTIPGSRWFVDENFADAVSSLDVCFTIQDGYSANFSVFKGVQHCLGHLGVEIIAGYGDTGGRVGDLVKSIAALSEKDPSNPLLIDFLNAISNLDADCSPKCQISEMYIKEISFDSPHVDYSRVSIDSCCIELLSLCHNNVGLLPAFSKSIIERVESHHEREFINSKISSDCEISEFLPKFSDFDEFRRKSKDDILVSMASILDKTFIQSQNGRQEGAFRRGLSAQQIDYVESIIETLRREAFIYKIRRRGETIWVPNLEYKQRVKSILRDPENSKDSVIQAIKNNIK